VRAGDGRFVVVEGGAGIGKTRLLSEARALAADMAMRTLVARGGELEREFAFGLVRQLFEPVLAAVSAEERAELFSGAAALSAPLFASVKLVDASATGEVSFPILHGLYWLAVNVASAEPALLVLDDVHWGDAPVAHVGRHGGRAFGRPVHEHDLAGRAAEDQCERTRPSDRPTPTTAAL
jgi:hypothetical protein